MLTPFFELSQTENTINIKIKAPLANVGNSELIVDNDNMVLFYSSPYYLRIHLPGNVREIEGSTGKYDSDSGEFFFELEKCTAGAHFEDLDMIGKLLLARNSQWKVKPKIEVLGEDVESSTELDEEEEEDWFIQPEELPDENLFQLGGGKYGFANKLCGLDWVSRTREEFYEILDLQDLDFSLLGERSIARKKDERNRFSEEHYMADFMDTDDLLQEALQFSPHWGNGTDKFTPEEKEILKNMGNREYLLDKSERKVALLSLVDIIFSYAYNHRILLGENSVESAWTINKLSATFSWFQSYTDMKDVKVTCARRAIVYPLYRHWELTQTVFKDTYTILSAGRRQLIKCLLEIYSLFNASEPRYLLNRLYVTDYCIWLQKCSEKIIQKLADSYLKVDVNKSDVELDIEELEAAALCVCEEEEQPCLNDDRILSRIKNISIKCESNSSNESSDSSSDESGSSLETDSDDGSSTGSDDDNS